MNINLIFPHQLFETHPAIENDFPIYLIEEYLFFRQYKFHKQKIAYHRASMKFYEAYLGQQGKKVTYIASNLEVSDIRLFVRSLQNVESIHFVSPVDYYLERRLASESGKKGIKLAEYASPMFLNTKEELADFFRSDKKKFFQTEFYIQQRKRRKILLKGDAPVGGKWSFDQENRKKYPKKSIPPAISYPDKDQHYDEAIKYVDRYFSENPGEVSAHPLYPYNYVESDKWLHQFLTNRFDLFGDYEDAIVSSQSILHHSVLTPMLNVGLLSPEKVLTDAERYFDRYGTPVNSVEGFIRQIIGWREFIRGIYEVKGTAERTTNFWDFKRKIPPSFYHATTGILPLDNVIKKVLQTGYCHHIERLMVLGNFMVLCEFDPDEVYKWFMELFIDAYDWVMVPNVYGMSQFADGGLMATKPYISGSNYLMKMSDYTKGPWQETWDALFWRFMHTHREFFLKNPRLSMLIRTFDKKSSEDQQKLIEKANGYLKSLDAHV